MSKIRINSITIENYRSFGAPQTFVFPGEEYTKPVAIVGYNNSGKTNLMNAILYGVGVVYIGENTFNIQDLHNCEYENSIRIESTVHGTSYMDITQRRERNISATYLISTHLNDGELESRISPSFFGTQKHYQVFNINFHKIKEEIITQKTNWGSIKSFLGKHIKKLVENDESMDSKKSVFKDEVETATKKVLEDSSLNKFIEKIKENYSYNLKNCDCAIEFGLPGYEDIFLQMLFKVGLNQNIETLIPIDHFGDGYISMFVMAVIQSIAESNADDKCLFLFEEPESFLHENHQEYFYKAVLCKLSESGHQVIYTTHSDKMIDLFDTKSLIRLEFSEEQGQTLKKYNNIEDFAYNESEIQSSGLLTIGDYNQFIKSIEPNLNKIVYSKKVLLLEGPNDLMAYKFALEKKIKEKGKDDRFAETYLSFRNISIIPHHGKHTAFLLMRLCKHLGLEFFVITDWDLVNNLDINTFTSIDELRSSPIYINLDSTMKGILTSNFQIMREVDDQHFHFNKPKLEGVLGYERVYPNDSRDLSYKDKGDSIILWNILQKIDNFGIEFFPPKLESFLEIDTISVDVPVESDDIPF